MSLTKCLTEYDKNVETYKSYILTYSTAYTPEQAETIAHCKINIVLYGCVYNPAMQNIIQMIDNHIISNASYKPFVQTLPTSSIIIEKLPDKAKFIIPDELWLNAKSKDYVTIDYTERNPDLIRRKQYPWNTIPAGQQFKWEYLGQFTKLVVSDDAYDEVNKLVDYFSYKPRMQCKRKGLQSPEEYFEQNKQKVNENAIRLQQRNLYKNLPLEYWIIESLYDLARKNECSTFKISLTKFIYTFFRTQYALDPSAGWGDRALGAASAGVPVYIGVDPSTKMADVYPKIIEFIKSKGLQSYAIYSMSFLDVNYPPETFDTVFTSPPFYDYEVYDVQEAEKQSIFGSPSIQQWLDTFMFPYLEKAWSFLKISGILALYITDIPGTQYMTNIYTYITDLLQGEYNGVFAVVDKSETHVYPIWVWKKTSTYTLGNAKIRQDLLLVQKKEEEQRKAEESKKDIESFKMPEILLPTFSISSIPQIGVLSISSPQKKPIEQRSQSAESILSAEPIPKKVLTSEQQASAKQIAERIRTEQNLPEYTFVTQPIQTTSGVPLHLVQEGRLPCGSKYRGIAALILQPEQEFVYTGANSGEAQVAVALAARETGRKATIFLRQQVPMHSKTKQAKDLGANIIEVPNATLRQLQQMATDYANKEGAYLVPFGFRDAIYINEMVSSFNRIISEDVRGYPWTIWLVVGSGVLLDVLLQVFPKAIFKVVVVGKAFVNPNPQRVEKAGESQLRFWEPTKLLPPYASIPEYDAKLWEFVNFSAQPNNIVWNVGQCPM